MLVGNKKGRIPFAKGLEFPSRTAVEVYRSHEGDLSIFPMHGEDEVRWTNSVRSRAGGRLVIPASGMPPWDQTTARFIGKVALEILTERCINVPGWNDELVEKPELDQLRQYVRFGQPKTPWPLHIRPIYSATHVFIDGPDEFQVLHEWTILPLKSGYFVVIAIFGIEYAINLGEPTINGYEDWLSANGNHSPLYSSTTD